MDHREAGASRMWDDVVVPNARRSRRLDDAVPIARPRTGCPRTIDAGLSKALADWLEALIRSRRQCAKYEASVSKRCDRRRPSWATRAMKARRGGIRKMMVDPGVRMRGIRDGVNRRLASARGQADEHAIESGGPHNATHEDRLAVIRSPPVVP